ncbi:Zinc finger, PMZ-type [Artemisia annua]|uniref:Zinc finger, PMZ-type n=1 Tax=Artemisia annua TaxID=35608 RepID=A0A2U1L8B3_ARTAN|nr:Zinc finger, PMZ-type [Artemisia annua]
MAEFVEQIRTLKKKVDIDVPNPPSKKDDMEKFIGVPKLKNIGGKNPSGAKNKGSTREVRRKSEKEKAIDASLKPKRKCRECGVCTNTHTKKTCPLGPTAIAAPKAKEEMRRMWSAY